MVVSRNTCVPVAVGRRIGLEGGLRREHEALLHCHHAKADIGVKACVQVVGGRVPPNEAPTRATGASNVAACVRPADVTATQTKIFSSSGSWLSFRNPVLAPGSRCSRAGAFSETDLSAAQGHHEGKRHLAVPFVV